MGKFKIGDRITQPGWRDRDACTVVSVGGERMTVRDDRGNTGSYTHFAPFVLVTPAITIEPGKHYRLRNGNVTGRVSTGDVGFEALVDGQVRVFDKAGGHVFGDSSLDLVEAWVPKVGQRVVEAAGKGYDLVQHWRDYWQHQEGPLADNSFVVTRVVGKQACYSNRAGGRGPQVTIYDLEPLPVAVPLRIQAGRYYKTRDGRKVGPMERFDSESWHASGAGRLYQENGQRFFESDRGGPTDLIAEWVDEPVVAVANDNVEAAKPKFKVGDRVRLRGWTPGYYEVTKIEGGDFWIKAAGLPDLKYSVDGDWVVLPSTPMVSPAAIVARIEDGIGKPSSKPKVHTSQADATTEAERLALKYPGQQFGVFVLADSKIADIVTTQTAVLRAA